VSEQTFWGPDFHALQQQDPEIAGVVLDELERLRGGLQLIASENLTSPAVLAALGSTLSNKYAEGYPGRRYYGGCGVVDVAENIGNARTKELFGAEHANLQPHSGASANLAAYAAFAKPGDTLAIAAEEGRLHRNFQGYTTDACQTLIGVGASSISSYGDAYVQNIVPTAQYEKAVQDGQISAMRGVQLNLDDRIRAWIIERLMCDFAFSFDALEDRFGYAARSYIAEAKIAVANDTFGLCHIDGNSFAIREEARPFTRIVASWFDAYLNDSSVRYSKAV